MRRGRALTPLIILLGLALIGPGPALASGFNQRNVITERDYTNKDAFSENDIQRFLEKHNSGLATLTIETGTAAKRVSTLFYEAAQEYNISPKLLLATAQKEQSAVTSTSLTQWQQNALMGYAVFPGNDESPYLGADKQIDSASWQFRRYLDKPQNFNIREGVEFTTSDGYTITPENQSTAALYNYTPYAGAEDGTPTNGNGGGGNFLFWKIWQDWFASVHPNGTLIRAEGTPGVYVLERGKKRGFWSRQAFLERYSDDQVVVVSSAAVESYGDLAPATFPDGTVLQAPNGAMFVIEHGKKRGITSRALFEELGYDFAQAVQATQLDLDIHPDGALYLESEQRHPDGALIKTPDHDGVFLLDRGKRRPIRYREVLGTQYDWNDILVISRERLELYPLGEDMSFRDGTLIKDASNGAIYFIEDGLRRRVASVDVLSSLGYPDGSVVTVPHGAVILHEIGEDLDVF
ncbi:MAG: hypothetical protein KC925_03195 [Candidatus Doudnabacteria bacterium]|nr:hypothetical protein [Candidatus Doudnabacteria bacterium]